MISTETFERLAAERILAGSSIPRTLWPEIARVANRGSRDCLAPLLGDDDFDWPWFDEWQARFEADGKLPEAWG